jgi:hypothetical protein
MVEDCVLASRRPARPDDEAPFRQTLLDVDDVELLVDVGVGADQVHCPTDDLRQLVPDRDEAKPLASLIPDPCARRLEAREPLAELVDRRLRVEEALDQDADDHARSSLLSSSLIFRSRSASSWPKSSR